MQPGPAFVGFDAVAERYDADEESNRILAHMRARSFRQLMFAFPSGARLIELGSGTGTEAAELATQKGVRVALVDVSPRLLEIAAAKVRAIGPHHLLGQHLLQASSIGKLVATYGRSSFDGAFSSFGPLNCEPSLGPAARGLSELVRPGGTLVLSIINRWCATEIAWYALRGRWRDAVRRWGGPVQASAYAGGPKDVRTWYYGRREIESAFAPEFRTEHVEALPLLWPPPYLDFLVGRFGRLFRVLESVEASFARMPFLRELGDHFLLRLRRN